MARSRLLLLAALVACNEYDLNRPDEIEEGGDPEEEPVEEEEPTEDPDIAVDPGELDFGGQLKDCPSDPLTFTVSNEGLGDLEVTDMTVAGSGNSAFELDWDGTPFTLAYEETRSFEIRFEPNAWVDFDVDVEITSNDPDEGLTKVPTVGYGSEDALYEQPFEQDYFEQVDVLWVVDNSGSMSDDLQVVANHFQDFINVFVELDLDYHMAIITTDMDNPAQSGKFVGEVITSDSADPVAMFVDQVDQGSGGSGSEQGFAAVEAALTEPLISTHNADFLREDAALGVIVISDEDDDSWMSSSDFASWLSGLKPSADMTTFSAICEDMFISCYQYTEAADYTGGIIGDIVSSDYDEIMESISMTSAGLSVSIDLEYEPSDLGRTTVMVEGVEVDMDSTNGWTYDSPDNAIVFHGSGVPEAGESGYIEYPVAGECTN